MRPAVSFLRNYRLFSITIVAVVIALVLELTGNSSLAHWLLGIISVIALLPLMWDMWQDLRSGTYGVDILAATAILTAVILGEYWAGIIVVLMLTGGEALEDFAEKRARSELDELLRRAPQKAFVVRKGKTIEVKADHIKVGERILIKPGELVPVDAIVLEGEASFDESSLTGEATPSTKQPGDQLLSGSLNNDGAITARATAIAADSQYQRIIKLVQGAAASRSPFVRLADRYSLPFTFIAFALATGVWLISGEAIRFLEVIIVATPCPLILAAPTALVSGMARASSYGIIVKSGSAMERLAETRTMIFDKTGTLTKGELVVESIRAENKHSQAEVLALAASLEQNSTHVVGRAIIAKAAQSKFKSVKLKQIRELSGRGLTANFRGQPVVLGRLSLLEENGVDVTKSLKVSEINQTAVYLAMDQNLIGVITLKDELRPEAEDTLNRLRQLGVRQTMMVTGDNFAAAKSVAKQLGISDFTAGALPADKIHAIEAIKERPRAFVGDGVNDAPVLTSADVGIALGARGSAAAAESADMVIMPNDLGRVAGAYDLSRQTFRIARQSILIGISMSVGLMLAFATGAFTPLAGALLQEVVDVFVIFNALRAHLITLD